ncbi:MAG: hypothetical protein Q8M16_03870 [Pirellulaceae bacterium]|nr:hypothetical protein [Pirellulaceae bacterium]
MFLETWQNRETFQLADQHVQVVSRSGLIQMKTIAGRLQDLADIEGLQQEPRNG